VSAAPAAATSGGAASAILARFFYQRSLRTRVVLSQLPLSISMLLVLAVVVVIRPATLQDPLFQAGLWLHAALLLACAVVPWHRLPFPSFLAIPYLDFAAIALSREGSGELLANLGLLVLFPVFWLAASGLARRTSVLASFACTLLLAWLPLLAGGRTTLEDLSHPFLLPLMMLGIAVSVSVMTNSMDAQRLSLEAKDLELRQALQASHGRQQLLDVILDTVSVGLVAVDAQGHDVLLNRTQRKFHRIASPNGNHDPGEPDLLIYAADRSTLLPVQDRPIRRAVRGEAFTDNLIWIGTGPGARALSSTARPITNAAGHFDGSVVAFYDVTDLVTALAAKDDFVANISHELRTPLTSILGFLGLALDDPASLPPELTNYLKVAERNADRLLTLVSDLLSVAAGSFEIRPRPTDLADLVEQSLDSAAPAAADHGVTLVNECQSALPVLGDIGRLGQVLDNLVSNAVKYTPDGGTVTIRGRLADASVVCEVQDTGIGMDSGEKAEAFTKFFRAGAVRRTAIPGVGLGLAITKAIVESHGGSISLRSEPGMGTTVRFELPGGVADDEAASEAVVAVAPARGARADPAGVDSADVAGNGWEVRAHAR